MGPSGARLPWSFAPAKPPMIHPSERPPLLGRSTKDNKLAKTFTTQMEALKRYRMGGQQKVTVEHVTVQTGGQAIVGNVSHPGPGGGSSRETRNQPHEQPKEPSGDASEPSMLRPIKTHRRAVQGAGSDRLERLPVSWSRWRRSQGVR
jgi:hypothetical protein